MTRSTGKNSLIRLAGAAAALQIAVAVASPGAFACEGQAGKEIFADNFADDSGGWELAPPAVTIKPPAMLLTLDAKATSATTLDLTFHAVDGDYCMDVILPKPPNQDSTMAAGIQFWATDYNNLMLVQLSTYGTLALYAKTAGNWQTIFNIPSAPAFKADPGAVNSIRVLAKAGKLTIFLNGTQMKVIRSQVPEGNLRFGIYGQFDKTVVPDSPPIQVTGYRVTTGE